MIGYHFFYAMRKAASQKQQLEQISEATVTRLLRQHCSRKSCLPHKGPERAIAAWSVDDEAAFLLIARFAQVWFPNI